MTLNEIPKFFGGLPPQTPLGGLTTPPKPPASIYKLEDENFELITRN